MSTPDAPKPTPLPRIRGTQVGLHNPEQVDKIKADMLSGRYVFHEVHGKLYGVKDSRGTFYVKVCHHRMVAALEICRETGDASFVWKLLKSTTWPEVPAPPNDGCPMPSRHWWGAVRNWLGY